MRPAHKRFNERTLADLNALKEHDPVGSLQVLIDSTGPKGATAEELSGLIDLPAKQIKTALNQILSQKSAIAYDKERGRIIGWHTFEDLSERVRALLEDYHRQYPVRPGLGKEETQDQGFGSERHPAFNLSAGKDATGPTDRG